MSALTGFQIWSAATAAYASNSPASAFAICCHACNSTGVVSVQVSDFVMHEPAVNRGEFRQADGGRAAV
jgi:hypothetical protein